MSSLWNPRMLAMGLVASALVLDVIWFGSPYKDPLPRKIGVILGRNMGWVAPEGVTVFRSAKELEAAFSPGEVQMDHPVDFGSECLVRVVWESAGVLSDRRTPGATSQNHVDFGRLQCHVRMAGRKALFCVEEPQKYGTVRLVFQRLHSEEWFAVSDNTQVAFVGSWTITMYDGACVLFSVSLVGVGLAIARSRKRMTAVSVCPSTTLADSEVLAYPSSRTTGT